jgi:hypothetical protein
VKFPVPANKFPVESLRPILGKFPFWEIAPGDRV